MSVSIQLNSQRSELLTVSTEIVRCKVIRRLVVKVVNEPAVSKRAVGDIGHSKFLASFNQTVRLMNSLEGGVLGLDGIDLGDWGCQ